MKKPTPVPTPAPVIPVTQTGQAGQTQGGGNPPLDPLQLPKMQSQDSITLNDPSLQGFASLNGNIRIQKSAEESIQTEKPIAQTIDLPIMPQPISNMASEDDGSILMSSNDSHEISGVGSMVISNVPEISLIDNSGSDGIQGLREMQLNRLKTQDDEKGISEDQDYALNNLFGDSPETAEESPNIIQGVPESIPEVVAEEIVTPIEPDEKFENPPSFIEASIEKIDAMITQIEIDHTAKVLEAAGYKGEKEKFASLESQAYKDGERMMKERDHGEKMKAYFLKEKDHADVRFENSHSFIQDSVEKINFMITHIDMNHASKLEEADEYKQEKEKFAALELQAYADGDKMMKEKAHAKRMKSYFLDQKKHSYEVDSKTPKESVETTLTSLSVKNSVDVATKHQETKKVSHRKSHEDALVIEQ